ncbi:MAG: 4-alpha-glucanotransferase [Acidobacteria bacterium]|nr:4-alpha-glucanotransferase [Acidobacteriota bacterium]
MPSPFAPLLGPLCAEFGIDMEFWDIWGRHHATEESAILSILASLGLETSSPEALQSSAAALHASTQARPLDPVTVLSIADSEPCVPFRAPAGTRVAVTLDWEQGWADRREFAVAAGQQSLPLPTPLRLGYHDLRLALVLPDGSEVRASQRIVVAPEKAWLPQKLSQGARSAGLAVSLYGLRSARNWGVGDFTDLAALCRWAAESLSVGFIALNPLHALHNRQPYNTSPYLPLSVYQRNFLYVDVEAVDEFAACPAARRLVASGRFQAELAALRSAEYVEYERVARLKRGVLRVLFRQFLRDSWQKDAPRARQFQQWAAEQGALLERFATYCALDEVLHARNRDLWIWPDWPEEYQHPDSPAVQEFVHANPRRVLFHKYVQWLIDLQIAAVQSQALQSGMPIGLYHDLALATDRCGADLWAHRPYYIEGCRVGSPPDDFAPEGQDWAFPPPNAVAHRANGYRLFAESIRRNARHGGALRIDHVMRFFRLFWIPEGHTAAQGTYVNEHWRDLIRILALESVRGRFLVVGEDLGTVPAGLREAMDHYGMCNYRLFYFEKGHDGMPLPCKDYPRGALVSSTTHDLPTLAGFWAGRDIEARRAAGILTDEAFYQRQKNERREEKRKMAEALIRDGFLPQDFPRESADWSELTGELHNAVIGYLMSTPSLLMLLNQEDLTKELDQQNLPGTTWQYPNWRRKMRYSLEDLESSPNIGDFALMLRTWLQRTGRAI